MRRYESIPGRILSLDYSTRKTIGNLANRFRSLPLRRRLSTCAAYEYEYECAYSYLQCDARVEAAVAPDEHVAARAEEELLRRQSCDGRPSVAHEHTEHNVRQAALRLQI